jgi:hypothetical protein
VVLSFARKKNEKAICRIKEDSFTSCRFVIHVVWFCLSRERKTRRSHQRRFFYKLLKEQTEKLVPYDNLSYDLVHSVIGFVWKIADKCFCAPL